MIIRGQRFKTVLLIVCVLSLSACCLDSESNGEDNNPIVGSWNWYKSSGGFAGTVQTPESTGETRKVIFQDNGSVTFYANDEATLSATFTLANEKTIYSEHPIPVVKVEGDVLGTALLFAYSFPDNNELELKDNFFDGFTHNYRKE